MGLIFHGSSSGGSVSDYITIELVGGKLRYSASLGSYQQVDDNHEVYLGDELADGSFHRLLIDRTGIEARIYLDEGKPFKDEAIALSRYKKLNLDMYLFVGGTIQKGLRGVVSTTNFEGCLRKFSFTSGSKVINLLSKTTGTKHFVEFQCPSLNYKPVTFTKTTSTCTKTLASPSSIAGKFMFRTYAKEGTVLTWGSGSDVMQVNFKDRFVELVIKSQESLSVNFDFSRPAINSGLWVKVEFSIASGNNGLFLKVNGKDDRKTAGSNIPSFGTKLTIGTGFVGCMQDLTIDSKAVDLDEPSCVDGVQFGKCNISDHCNPNPCLNEGECVQEGLSFQCTCKPDYQGSVCQFSKHPKSCNEIRLDQLKGNGDKTPINQNYTIDPDGSGPIKPFLAYCNMTHGRQLNQGMTVVRSLDHHVRVRVANPSEAEKPESFIRDIRYYPNLETAKAVVMQSEECSQYIEYSCINSKLLNDGNPFYGRWVSRTKHEKYWGGAKPDSLKCACGMKGNCVDKSKGCNCDAGRSTLEKDYGQLTDTHSLPVTQVLLGDVNPLRSSQANVSVGDLFCSGEINNTATFVNEDGYLQLPPWTPPSVGDISFLFRTPYAKGIILHNGDITREYFRVHIVNNQTLRLDFDLGHGLTSVDAKLKSSSATLDDRKWHKVLVWHNQKEFGLKLDDESNEVNLPLHLSTQLNVAGKLNVGGYSRDQLNGFVGCIKGLAINGKVYDLYGEAKNADYVKSDCGAACKNNHCMNGAECIDYYNIYKCNCDNVPFYGYFCHREIGASFNKEDSKIVYEYPSTGAMIGTDIAIAFATQSCGGMLLEIKSSDVKDFYRIRFRKDTKKLLFEFQTGSDDQFEFENPTSGSFCDNERHTLKIRRTRPITEGRLYVTVDNGKEILKSLGNLKSFSKPKVITIGGKSEGSLYSGCISGVKVTQFQTGDVKLSTVDPIRLWREGSDHVKAYDVVKGQCGPVSPTPPQPTKRIPDDSDRRGDIETDAPGEGPGTKTDRSQVAVIVVVVLILVLVIIALLVLIYWYWSRHKGTYHTHEDNENLQNAEPYIELQQKQPPPSDGGDTQKKKEWYI